MDINYINRVINNEIQDNHYRYKNGYINSEIDYNELKKLSIEIIKDKYNELEIYKEKFEEKIINKFFNENNDLLKFKNTSIFPSYFSIIANDFIKFTFEIVQKTMENVLSRNFNSCFNDGDRLHRLPQYKYHYYLIHNKKSSVYSWFDEYKNIFKNHLEILNGDRYDIQKNIIYELIKKLKIEEIARNEENKRKMEEIAKNEENKRKMEKLKEKIKKDKLKKKLKEKNKNNINENYIFYDCIEK